MFNTYNSQGSEDSIRPFVGVIYYLWFIEYDSRYMIPNTAFVDGLKAKKLPPEMRIAKAKIIGCQHCSFVVSNSDLKFSVNWFIFKLKDFVSDEIPMFHNVEFQEASGSEKRILEFFNQKGDRLLETDVSEESFDKVT